MTALFYASATVAVVASALAVTRTHAVHALLYLIVGLFGVALCFLALGAPFVAALEVIVYAGAIMVLFLFVLMMLNLGRATRQQERRWLPARAWIVPLLLSATLLAAALEALLGAGSGAPTGDGGTAVDPAAVGRSLFTDYVIGVELASVLLLAGLVGAWYLGTRAEAGRRGSR